LVTGELELVKRLELRRHIPVAGFLPCALLSLHTQKKDPSLPNSSFMEATTIILNILNTFLVLLCYPPPVPTIIWKLVLHFQ
jgi:hypothetical protein